MKNSSRNIKAKKDFSARETAQLGGLSKTMLDYLCRNDIAAPACSKKRGKGIERRFSFGDVILLRAIGRILKAGISVKGLKEALKALRKFHPEITPLSLPGTHLITDGKRIYFQHENKAIEELVSGQFSFAFVIELKGVRDEVLQHLKYEQSTNDSNQFYYQLNQR